MQTKGARDYQCQHRLFNILFGRRRGLSVVLEDGDALRVETVLGDDAPPRLHVIVAAAQHTLPRYVTCLISNFICVCFLTVVPACGRRN